MSVYNFLSPASLKLLWDTEAVKYGLLGGSGLAAYSAESACAAKQVAALSTPYSPFGPRNAIADSAGMWASRFGWLGGAAFKGVYAAGVAGTVVTSGATGYYTGAYIYCRMQCVGAN